jgi:hypothetical protein
MSLLFPGQTLSPTLLAKIPTRRQTHGAYRRHARGPSPRRQGARVYNLQRSPNSRRSPHHEIQWHQKLSKDHLVTSIPTLVAMKQATIRTRPLTSNVVASHLRVLRTLTQQSLVIGEDIVVVALMTHLRRGLPHLATTEVPQ